LSAVASALIGFQVLYVFRLNETLGPVISSFFNIFKEIGNFLLISISIHIGFSFAMFFFFIEEKTGGFYESIFKSFYNLGFTFLIEVDTSFLDSVKSPAKVEYGRIIYSVYVILFGVIFMNLLVAMMNTAYKKMSNDLRAQFRSAKNRVLLELVEDDDLIPAPFTILYLFPYAFCLVYRMLKKWIPSYRGSGEHRFCKVCGSTLDEKRMYALNTGIVRSEFSCCMNLREFGHLTREVGMDEYLYGLFSRAVYCALYALPLCVCCNIVRMLCIRSRRRREVSPSPSPSSIECGGGDVEWLKGILEE
jgi:hypothetical protein